VLRLTTRAAVVTMPLMRAAVRTILAGFALSVAAAAGAQSAPFVIGTADVVGNYYPLGRAICRIVNATRKEHGLRCRAEPTEGSVANIEGVLAGTLDAGLAQGDTQYHARTGGAPFAGRPQPKLRALFTVDRETFTLVARRDANVRTFDDLRGKRVAIGARGSGTRATMEQLMKASGVAPADFQSVVELRFVDLDTALCDGRIDAFVFVGGHPNASIADASTACAARIVGIAGPAVDALLAAQPYYAKSEIPGGMYKGNEAAQPSFGMAATLVVSADLPDATAYAVTKAVFEHFDDLRRLYPAMGAVTRAEAARNGVLPVHPGALRYFKEAGLE
jgi:uncharacterized protein